MSSLATPNTKPVPNTTTDEQQNAAKAIQRTYRGHRTRRQLDGLGLDASTRWYEAVTDAQYREATRPRAPGERIQTLQNSPDDRRNSSPAARKQWKRATNIAQRAGQGGGSPSVSEDSSDDGVAGNDPAASPLSPEDRQKRHEKRKAAVQARKKTAKMMDLEYFLEMVDHKHRYGSNLRKYHAYWQQQDTPQSFFYWLDQGDGLKVDLEERSRKRLDTEQVRYLSREERMQYLVRVNDMGLLEWAKNGELVWTKDELYKDSIKGIVPISDPTPEFQYNVPPPGSNPNSDSSISDSESDNETNAEADEGEVKEDSHHVKGPTKLKHVPTAVSFNHIVRKSLKKGRKWVYVVDLSFRMYIGYKQSGSFQHSSFLHGSRISAAGQIKVKHGQLRKLLPLSGHYKPTAENFKHFVQNLRDEGVDMSRVSISKSYAVLLGTDGYIRTTKKIKNAEKAVGHGKDKILHPGKVEAEKAAARDKSKSAEQERLYLENQKLEMERKPSEADRRFGTRLSNAFSGLSTRKSAQENTDLNRRDGTR